MCCLKSFILFLSREFYYNEIEIYVRKILIEGKMEHQHENRIRRDGKYFRGTENHIFVFYGVLGVPRDSNVFRISKNITTNIYNHILNLFSGKKNNLLKLITASKFILITHCSILSKESTIREMMKVKKNSIWHYVVTSTMKMTI